MTGEKNPLEEIRGVARVVSSKTRRQPSVKGQEVTPWSLRVNVSISEEEEV